MCGPSLRRVYTSCLRMRLPHRTALRFFITYLGLLMPMKKSYYYKNATQCGKRMGKPDVATWLNLGYNTQEINLYSSSVAGL